jgi:hypothetical protein
VRRGVRFCTGAEKQKQRNLHANQRPTRRALDGAAGVALLPLAVAQTSIPPGTGYSCCRLSRRGVPAPTLDLRTNALICT